MRWSNKEIDYSVLEQHFVYYRDFCIEDNKKQIEFS